MIFKFLQRQLAEELPVAAVFMSLQLPKGPDMTCGVFFTITDVHPLRKLKSLKVYFDRNVTFYPYSLHTTCDFWVLFFVLGYLLVSRHINVFQTVTTCCLGYPIRTLEILLSKTLLERWNRKDRNALRGELSWVNCTGAVQRWAKALVYLIKSALTV